MTVITEQEQRIVSDRRLDAFRAADALWRAVHGDDDEVDWLEHELLCRAMAWAAEVAVLVDALNQRRHAPTQLPVHPYRPGLPAAVNIDNPDTYPEGFRAV